MTIFTNTQSRAKELFEPVTAGQVTMYTCGPTVYNYAHIGNFRANVTYDLVKRWLRYRGFAVKHVMNITDVEDKTIGGAQAAGVPLEELTAKYTAAFFEDCKTLRLLPADFFPRATEHIPEMVEMVRQLVEKGFGYVASDGCVYFSIEKFDDYGKLSHLDKRELRHGARVAHDEYDKDNISDFALWKAWTADDGDVKWDSPWGPGRPGWHLECSVMARKYLDDTIDIHMGGEDLIFPHHENEIAQSEATTGKQFVRYWLHNAYLLVEGKKMSKSLGNFFTVRDLLDKGWTGREIRYVLLSAHYRQQLNFTFDGLHAARSALQRLDDTRAQLAAIAAQDGSEQPCDRVAKAIESAKTTWLESLDDDLNISPALGAMFDLVRQANRWADEKCLTPGDASALLEFLDETDEILAVAGERDAVPDQVLELAKERETARKERNWARADVIRETLTDMGYTIEDTPSGPRVKKR